jgi:hypothetical protein
MGETTMKFRARLLAALVMASTQCFGAGNLIVNGNFDNGLTAGTCVYDPTPSGWKTLSEGVEGGVQILSWGCNGMSPPVGGHFVDLTGGDSLNSASVLYQDVSTKVGSVYQLTFYFGGNPLWYYAYGVSGIANDGPLKAMQLYVNSVLIQTYTVNSAVAAADMGPQWVQGTYTFVATSTTTVISFHSLNGNNSVSDPNGMPAQQSVYGPLLSGVSLIALSAGQ